MNGRRVLALAAVYAAAMTGLRLLIAARGAAGLGPGAVPGHLLGAAQELVIGLLLAALLAARRAPLRALGWMLTATAVVVNLVCHHYQATFGRPPAASMLYYLRELPHLASSTDARGSWLGLAAAAAAVLAVLALAARRLRIQVPAGRPLGVLGRGLVLAALATSAVALGWPGLVPETWFWGSRQPLTWLLESALLSRRAGGPGHDAGLPSAAEVDRFRQFLGHAAAGPALDPRYPLCRPALDDAGAGNGRSAIVLILESVGDRELRGSFRGRPLMPALQRIAADGVWFRHHVAAGTKSAQALPALFSGLPPQTSGHLLWATPLPRLDGFPRHLRRRGYRTAYFHGGDLSFEKQRPYLRQVGFDEIVEYDPARGLDVHGWGWDDGTVLRELQSWIARHRRASPSAPYLAALFTLSSHDPYLLPADWTPVFSARTRSLANDRDWSKLALGDGEERDDPMAALAESYRFLDHHLGLFYQWYLAHERPRGTRLLLLGDHTPILGNRGDRVPRFKVPLIVAGLDDEERRALAGAEERRAAQFDLPATVMDLLDLPPAPCDLGVSLVQPDATWPAARSVLAVGGDALERISVWNAGGQVELDRARRRLRPVDSEPLAAAPADDDPERTLEQAGRLVSLALSINDALLRLDAYAPPRHLSPPPSPVPPVSDPIFVAHRGNVDGPDAPVAENSRAALEAAIDAGFAWAEIDVQVTRDGVAVVHHDPAVVLDGVETALDTLTLDAVRAARPALLTLEQAIAEHCGRLRFLVELKATRSYAAALALIDDVDRVLRARPAGCAVIVDSFQRELAAAVAHRCDCPAALDLPYRQPVDRRQLLDARELGMAWVYVEHSVADADTIRAAHALGLRVMVYTVNDPARLDRWRQEPPDGILTDHRAVRDAWR